MKTKTLTQAAIIAALYVVLTHLANAFGLASGAVQVRLSEALTVLPYFTPAAIPGLFLGCLIANLTTGLHVIDVLAGSLVTLFAAYLTYILRRHSPWLAPLPPIVLNALVVPLIIRYVYQVPGAVLYFVGTVAMGEILSAGLLGMLLLYAIKKNPRILGS